MSGRVKILLRIVISGVILAGLKYYGAEGVAFYIVPYVIAGYDVLAEAWEGVRSGEIFVRVTLTITPCIMRV